MRERSLSRVGMIIVVAVAACGPFREAMERHTDIVAQADGYTLTVEHAARLLSKASEKVAPASPQVADPLADLWVGYTLLAAAYARPDSFESLNLTPLIALSRDQEMVWALHRDVIDPRAELPESQLRKSYEQEQPWAKVRASQILVRIPDSASAGARDSLHSLAQDIRARAEAGEDFKTLARRYSDDPTTASKGGDLGWVDRGQLLPELDGVLFSLPLDSISEVITTRVGYHIVEVTDRQSPAFDSVAANYRSEVKDRRAAATELSYIDSLFTAADPRFSAGAVSLARRLASSWQMEHLSPARRRSVLVRFNGGELTAGDYVDFLLTSPQNIREAFAGADTLQVRRLLREIVRNELLTKAARDNGYKVSETTLDSLRLAAQREIHLAGGRVGMRRADLIQGDSAIVRAVDEAVERVLTQRASPDPLRHVLPALASGQLVQIYPDRFAAVARRLAELRGSAAGTATPSTSSGSAPHSDGSR